MEAEANSGSPEDSWALIQRPVSKPFFFSSLFNRLEITMARTPRRLCLNGLIGNEAIWLLWESSPTLGRGHPWPEVEEIFYLESGRLASVALELLEAKLRLRP